MNIRSILFRLLPALLAGLALAGPAFAQVGGFSAAPPATIEILGFGKEIGELRVVQGAEQALVNITTLPPGASVPLRGGQVEFQQRVALPEGGERWVPVASVNIADRTQPVTAMLLPNRQPDDKGHLYGVKVFRKTATLPSGAFELCNLTPTTVLVQTDMNTPPVEIAAWQQQVFTPKLDRKYRSILRVAYRTNPTAPWQLAKTGIVSLPPDQSVRSRFVFAASGLGGLADPEDLASVSKPLLLLLDETVPVTKTPAP